MNPTILHHRKRPLSPLVQSELTAFFPSVRFALITDINQLIKERTEEYGNFMLHTQTDPEMLFSGEVFGYEFDSYEYYAVKALQKTNFMYCLLVEGDTGYETFRHTSTIHEPSGRQVGRFTKVSFPEIVSATQP